MVDAEKEALRRRLLGEHQDKVVARSKPDAVDNLILGLWLFLFWGTVLGAISATIIGEFTGTGNDWQDHGQKVKQAIPGIIFAAVIAVRKVMTQ